MTYFKQNKWNGNHDVDGKNLRRVDKCIFLNKL